MNIEAHLGVGAAADVRRLIVIVARSEVYNAFQNHGCLVVGVGDGVGERTWEVLCKSGVPRVQFCTPEEHAKSQA
eukprot:335527-Rhodomonas_salina.2